MAEQHEDPATPRRSVSRSGHKRTNEPGSVTLRYPRKRALKACHVCRTRKTKCDNVQPTCGSCASIGTTCSFEETQKDYSPFDPASLEILRKLDQILTTQNDLVHAVRNLSDVGLSQQRPTSPTSPTCLQSAGPGSRITVLGRDAVTPWEVSRDGNPSHHSHLSPEHHSPVNFTRGSSNPITALYHSLPQESSETATGSPIKPTDTTAARWFGLLTNDVAREVAEVAKSNFELDRSSGGISDDQDHDGATPLQRATRIVDGQKEAEDLGLGQFSEERLWRAEDDIRLLRREHFLFENFVLRLGQWFDLFDPMNKFSTLVPHLALRNAGLMNAILALSCRYLSRNPNISIDEPPDQNSALQYYYEALHYVQRAMQYSTYQASHELLATTLVISTYEMLDGSRRDWERHLEGVFWIQRSRDIRVESEDFTSAVWWAWLRQDVWAAFREKRKTFTAWTPEKAYTSLTPHQLASRSIWIMAQVVNFCSEESYASSEAMLTRRLESASELRNMLSEWHQHLTVEFSPLPRAGHKTSTIFQPLWIRPPCLGLAIQLHHAARLLLCVNEPFLGGVDTYLKHQRTIQECIRVVCGVAMALNDDASSVISSQSLYIVGMFTQDQEQRKFILELLESCRQRTGWPTGSLGEELQHIWSKP